MEQIIGRALRQYGAEHYDHPLLNSAHFFLRVDNESVFTDAINGVKAKLKAEGAALITNPLQGKLITPEHLRKKRAGLF